MLIKIKQGYKMACDICGEEELITETFDELIKLKTEKGWCSRKVGNARGFGASWMDACPSCKNLSLSVWQEASPASKRLSERILDID